MLAALEELLNPHQIVIIRGAAAEVEEWRSQLARWYAPRRMVLAVPGDAAELPAALADKPVRGAVVAYVCEGSVCGAPVCSLAQLILSLRGA